MTTPINEWNGICISTDDIQLSGRVSVSLLSCMYVVCRSRQFIGWGNPRLRRTNKQDPRPKGCSSKYRRKFRLISSLKQGKHRQETQFRNPRRRISSLEDWWIYPGRNRVRTIQGETVCGLRSQRPATTATCFDIISEAPTNSMHCYRHFRRGERENETYCTCEHVSRNKSSLRGDIRLMSEHFSTVETLFSA